MNGRKGGVPTGTARVSEIERETVITRLNNACGDGRLTVSEFSERVEEAHVARTRTELRRLVTDLPGSRSPAPELRTEWHVSPIGAIRRHGHWHMDRHLVSLTAIGGANLDLRGAELAAPEVTLTKVSLLGGVTVCVPAGVRVIVQTFSLLGGRGIYVDRPACPGAPTLRIRAFALLGAVDVQTPHHAAPPTATARNLRRR